MSIVLLLLAAWLYARGTRAVWRAAGPGRGVTRLQLTLFASGWLVAALSLLSPLHALGGALLSAHMAQHELLMVVAAPLLVLARPLVPFTWALAPGARRVAARVTHVAAVRATWGAITGRIGAWILHAAAIWVWHVPRMYDASLAHEWVHALQHASFLGTALLFWWSVLPRGSVHVAGSIASLFTTMLHTSFLGALLAFSPTLWYAPYAATTAPWGLSPLEDQGLAGLIMWVLGSVPYLAAALALLARLLRRDASGRSFDTATPSDADPLLHHS